MDTLWTLPKKKWLKKKPQMLEKLNAPGGIRTHGLRIRNPALYPPELRGLKKYQLLTVIFFSSFVKLCQIVPAGF